MAIFVRVVFEGRVENGHKFENIIFRVPAIFKMWDPPGRTNIRMNFKMQKKKLKYSLAMAYYKLSNICVVFGGRIPVAAAY